MKPSDTKIAAYRAVVAAGEDVSLRRRVAAALAVEPMTTNELTRRVFPDKSENAVQPRATELVMMGCARRRGKRTNPSGHEAYVHHLTDRGYAYLDGRIDPEPGMTMSERKTNVVDTARAVVRGEADVDVLQAAVELHDDAKRRMHPNWDP